MNIYYKDYVIEIYKFIFVSEYLLQKLCNSKHIKLFNLKHINLLILPVDLSLRLHCDGVRCQSATTELMTLL